MKVGDSRENRSYILAPSEIHSLFVRKISFINICIYLWSVSFIISRDERDRHIVVYNWLHLRFLII